MIGRIYKIICTQSNDIYIGSTFNTLRQRLYRHKSQYNNGQKYSLISYFDKYGIDNFKIILIKEYEVADKKHILAYEQLWINKLKPINKNHTYHIDKINRSQYLNRKRNYYKENKDTKIKEYLEKNKDKIKAQRKEYKEKNKERYQQIETCECGGSYYKNNSYKKERHIKTKKHLNYISNNIVVE
jgi:hypothetical protein